MTTPTETAPLRKTPLLTAREVWWTMFAALSVCYLAVHFLAPEWLDELTPSTASLSDEPSNQNDHRPVRLSSDLRALQMAVGQMQLDLARVKTDLVGEAAQMRALATKVATLQDNGLTAAKANEPPAPAKVQVNAAAPDITQPIAAAEPTALPEVLIARASPGGELPPTAALVSADPPPQPQAAAIPPPQHRIINAPAPAATAAATPVEASTVETGSVSASQASPPQAAPISFGPAVVKRAAKPVGIQIMSSSSIDSLRSGWGQLSEQNGAELKSLKPHVLAKGDALNQSFDLIAGPVKSKSEALKLCKALAAKNIACKVGDLAGTAL